ncbi:tetratricopeptide repeat protein [Herbaspirillum huttiense]|uniref:tetratricopeptide repeat protein n=1 Tax=Herbaspirillum huttiense TaxID=863372 RepID=UPI000420B275|nr:SEL1-like repeat protein [Herbaspirillum huttiense]
MAARNDLAILKAARTGAADAQLALGKRYYLGSGSLPQSVETAFYWLERAARQGLSDAWKMIGRAVPYELVLTMSRPYEAAIWYERAFDSGEFKAGVVFSKLVLEHPQQFTERIKYKAVTVLKQLAERNDHEAQWLLAKHLAHVEVQHGSSEESGGTLTHQKSGAKDHWIKQAALAGVTEAQFSLLEKNWTVGDYDSFFENSVSLVERIYKEKEYQLRKIRDVTPSSPPFSLTKDEARLLLRHSQILLQHPTPDIAYSQRLLELAALSQCEEAQYRLGMLHARINHDCERVFPDYGQANYLAAVPWLNVAGERGLAEAWHALSMIFSKAEYYQRNLPLARQHLKRSAEMGFAVAQFEYAQYLWRTRRDDPMYDIRALFWWKKSTDQGHRKAQLVSTAFSSEASGETFATEIAKALTPRLRAAYPFLSARLDLAAAFNLSKAEALLIDVRRADYGHCLEVDISSYHGRSKRRLILVESDKQRISLNLISRLFTDVDASFEGPEGNYRQRQYRLKTVLSELN